MVGEHDTVGCVRVAADAELAAVMQPVMVWAQTDQVPGVGRAVVVPVDDVMDLHEVMLATARNPAALITQDHNASGAVGHDVPAATHRDGYPIGDEHR